MNIIIEKAKLIDAIAADNLLTKLIHDEMKYNNNINMNFKVKSYYKKYINDPKCCLLIAKDDNNIITGYIYGYLISNDSYAFKTAVIDALYVEEKYRNKGIGTLLIESFKHWALENDIHELEISVLTDNKVANHLYSKNGFKDCKKTMHIKL